MRLIFNGFFSNICYYNPYVWNRNRLQVRLIIKGKPFISKKLNLDEPYATVCWEDVNGKEIKWLLRLEPIDPDRVRVVPLYEVVIEEVIDWGICRIKRK